jgi:DNA-binding NarL/FixJ family response regulator
VHVAIGLARLLALEGDGASARRQYQESLTLLFEFNVYKENIAAGLESEQVEAILLTPMPARSASAPPMKLSTSLAGLTAREVEVLRLIAQGWTDAQIAEHLVISPRTVNRHTTSMYSKLGVSSRAAATRYAMEHHLQ